ncbi:membrane protein [Gracilibacillus halophilus YIM-C55.5]|uniref:Membrane protein n=1 Tax=Gracilibacillus halophilus YIM-C55.5 TaxID=1308866 RepID=N4WHL5_9BACI|nr:ABC transporter permease subunit [Gracilibacillus halophilus]ENH95672.1 membrane protein [Gracilibacillus halophilus YIM-C55.5]
MFPITFKEFKSLFKSIRSIIIIIVIFGTTLGIAKLVSNFKEQLEQFGLGENTYAGGAMIMILFAGHLFVASLSHNIINQEITSRTIRFIATKTSRNNIIIGKFLGITLFWTVCLFINFLLIIPFSKTFYFSDFLQSLIFICYFIGLTILLSTIISRPALTMFIGITLSIIMTILGFWSIASDNIYLKIYSYLTPYFYYSQQNLIYPYLVLMFPILFLILSLLIMRKRDL